MMENMVVRTPTIIVMLGLSAKLGGEDLGGGGSGGGSGGGGLDKYEVVMEGLVNTIKIINGVGHGDL